MDNQLVRYDGEGIEILIDQVTGEAFASTSGYARMSGLSVPAISKRLKGVNRDEIKTAEISTSGGVQGVNLINAQLCFRWLMKDNPALALKMGECGATVFLHKLAGYELKSTAVEEVLVKKDSRLVLLEQLTQLTQSQIEMEQRQAELALENQRLRLEQDQIRSEQNLLQESVVQHDAELGRIFEPDGMLITLAGCLNLQGKHATAAQLANVGKTAANIYRGKYGKDPEKISDARYGKVGAYPQLIAEEALRQHGYL